MWNGQLKVAAKAQSQHSPGSDEQPPRKMRICEVFNVGDAFFWMLQDDRRPPGVICRNTQCDPPNWGHKLLEVSLVETIQG